MPRLARVGVPGVPYHLTQRGNNRQDMFFVDDDRLRYLDLLVEVAERFELRVLGYCRRQELPRSDDPAGLELMRLRTRTDRPLGSDSFISKLDSARGRPLRALPVGRPRKRKGDTG